MSVIKISLFGKFCIEANDYSINRVESRKAEELLAYLLLHRDRPNCRDKLADVLWSELDSEQSRSYLRKALWQLQSLLESFGEKHILLVDGEWLQINPDLDICLDVAIIEDTYKSTQGLPGRKLNDEQAQGIIEATKFYTGDLLEGQYQEWCLFERERLQYYYLSLLDKLLSYCEFQHKYEEGILIGEKILRYDKARESTHRRLMRLYYLVGDRTNALRQYWKCITILKEELDVGAARSTRLLYESIKSDTYEITEITHLPQKGVHMDDVESPLVKAYSQLNDLINSLNQLQNQLFQEIKSSQKSRENNCSAKIISQ